MNEAHAFPVARLSEAFTGHRCVTAWLGYGSVLFLGFGEKVLSERDQHGRHTRPPFELETNFADWFVEGPTIAASADSDRAQLIAAAESLIGEQVVSWELPESKNLRVTFTGKKLFAVEAWGTEDGLADAWCLKSPDGRILAVATDGRFVVVDASLPVREWFDSVAQ